MGMETTINHMSYCKKIWISAWISMNKDSLKGRLKRWKCSNNSNSQWSISFTNKQEKIRILESLRRLSKGCSKCSKGNNRNNLAVLEYIRLKGNNELLQGRIFKTTIMVLLNHKSMWYPQLMRILN